MPSSHSKKSRPSSNGHRPHVVPTSERADRPSKPNNVRTSLTNAPNPLIYGLATAAVIFGITFLIVGAVHLKSCTLETMLPIWLLVMGLNLAIGGTWLFFVVMRIKKEPFRSVGLLEKIVSVSLFLIYIAWFIIGNVYVFIAWGRNPDFGHTWFSNGCDKSVFVLACVATITLDAILGNVWVYIAWGQHPDYGHTWFSNGCDKSVFVLSFVAIITLDALVGLALIGFCFWGVTKIVVRE